MHEAFTGSRRPSTRVLHWSATAMNARTTRRAVLAGAAALPAMSLPAEVAAAIGPGADVVRVNDLYPKGVPPAAGKSRPLSQFYGSLAQVRAAFPSLDFAF